MPSRILYYLIFIALLLTIVTCANERAITGGPKDEEAPRIVFATPENESVNVDSTIEIYVKFNEQMQKSTFESAIQIWPRPPGGFEIKSGWTWLKLSFNEPLDQNETYLLTLDKSAEDLRGNGLESTYVLAFSTGEVLNAGRLTGRIHGSADIKKNGDLLLYRRFDTDLGELRKEAADYVFQPDDAGFFELPYLSEKSYMLFYHWDRNRNKRIDGEDYFARPERASVQARTDSMATRHQLWPQLIPLDKVKLLGVSQLADRFIQIRANRLVTSESLEKIDLFIANVQVPILGASIDTEDDFAMNLDIALPLEDSSQVWLHNFQDTSGFGLHSDTLQLRTQTSFDTLGLSKMSVVWNNDKTLKYPQESSTIKISSTLPMIFQADSGFQLVDRDIDSVKIPGSLEKISSMEWHFTPDSSLSNEKTYAWQIETQAMHIPLNTFELDSLMQGVLTTVHPDSLGSLRVIHMGINMLECRLTGQGVDKEFRMEPGIAVVIEDLPARSYALTAYADKDGDGRYSSGGLGPAAKSEPFWIYPDEIKVRARWETDLGIWYLK